MADVTISQLDPTTNVTGSLVIPTSNGSVTTSLSLNQISNFITANSYYIEYIIVGGGGGGGSQYYAGGGGGGGGKQHGVVVDLTVQRIDHVCNQ